MLRAGALIELTWTNARTSAQSCVIGGFAGRVGEPDSGKFTLTLRKAGDGRWLILSDMDNGNNRR